MFQELIIVNIILLHCKVWLLYFITHHMMFKQATYNSPCTKEREQGTVPYAHEISYSA